MADSGDQDIPLVTKPPKIPRSAYFALAVLVLTNLFNMLDRSIVAILAQSIKADPV